MNGNVKIALLGGGGLRTPLLMHGIAQAQSTLGVCEIALYDIDPRRAALMQKLGEEVMRGSGIQISAPATVEETVDGARFVLSSVRVGGIEARARDERITIDHGLAGQETTGPGGIAMALRTIPVALSHARVIERYAPAAWLINFTNPAGLITQAISNHTNVKVVGICDTPAELFHRIAWALGEPFEEMEFRYAGLNHLGWVRDVIFRGNSILARLLGDDEILRRLYPADLFDPVLVRTLALIPTEYLFFYYSQRKAYGNQLTSGASRGEEILALNSKLLQDLWRKINPGDSRGALELYKFYLNQRNSSYMRLEGNAESAFTQGSHDWDPFEGATGYHRIAVEVMSALSSEAASNVVVNVTNNGAINEIAAEDVVEIPCSIDAAGIRPSIIGRLPDSVRGLVQSVKQCERLAIQAAVERSFDIARMALFMNPIVSQWEIATEVLGALVGSDPEHLGYLGT